VSFYSPYGEDNRGGMLWLGSTRADLGTDGNRFSVVNITNINSSSTPTVRVDEVNSFYLQGDFITNTATGGTYQFYPKYAQTFNIQSSQDIDTIKFYNQDTGVEITKVNVTYLTLFITTSTFDSSYQTYLGKNTVVHASSYI